MKLLQKKNYPENVYMDTYLVEMYVNGLKVPDQQF